MFTKRRLETSTHPGFHFKYQENIVYFKGEVISLTPHESDILHVLLNNRQHPTPTAELIKAVYGAFAPASAAGSIRVAVHSLRKKLRETGISIEAAPRVGYKVDASTVPELNNRLSDKILLALDAARNAQETEIVRHLESALSVANARRQLWLEHNRRAMA